VHARSGVAGGYRLGAGAQLPPLLLDDEEAVALAVGLRTAAGGTVTGIEETSMRVLAKLEQVLPSRLWRRVNALGSHTVPLTGSWPTANPGNPGADRRRLPRPRGTAVRLPERTGDVEPAQRGAPWSRAHRPALVPGRVDT